MVGLGKTIAHPARPYCCAARWAIAAPHAFGGVVYGAQGLAGAHFVEDHRSPYAQSLAKRLRIAVILDAGRTAEYSPIVGILAAHPPLGKLPT